ncbi:MAG TPA: SUMF1/EgtB/PvdO family nonheme iron enzyme, partial [Leptospiraceae bacterium]|nr:SUMF1/EgtB/PvdO family nonheme iron enzyme [Leptospiraceae bacterium]
ERNSTGRPGRVRNVSNLHGIYDMHGLVWEWVDDFNSVMISDESREGGSDKQMFCGGGAANAADFRNYAAFMRYAFRSSLRSNFTSSSLGFRCARNQ